MVSSGWAALCHIIITNRCCSTAPPSFLSPQADLDAARQEAADRAAERNAEAERARREATRAERLEEAAEELRGQLERVRRLEGGGGEGASAELAAECSALRKMVNCNVCHQRQKAVIITKCFHMFCNHCIKRNLESRHRKCPGCGAGFGQGDVRQFFFT